MENQKPKIQFASKDPSGAVRVDFEALRSIVDAPINEWISVVMGGLLTHMSESLMDDRQQQKPAITVLYTIALNIVGIEAAVRTACDTLTSMEYAQNEFARPRVFRVMWHIAHQLDFATIDGTERLTFSQEAFRQALDESFKGEVTLAEIDQMQADTSKAVTGQLIPSLFSGSAASPDGLALIVTILRMEGQQVEVRMGPPPGMGESGPNGGKQWLAA